MRGTVNSRDDHLTGISASQNQINPPVNSYVVIENPNLGVRRTTNNLGLYSVSHASDKEAGTSTTMSSTN